MVGVWWLSGVWFNYILEGLILERLYKFTTIFMFIVHEFIFVGFYNFAQVLFSKNSFEFKVIVMSYVKYKNYLFSYTYFVVFDELELG